MTPAIRLLKKNKIFHIVHQYTHESDTSSYGSEASEKLGIVATRVFKTIVVSLEKKELAVGIVPVSAMLNMKKIAKSVGAKRAVMALPADVERSSGYILGGVSPLGQKKRLKTVIDCSAETHETIFVSAGRRGLEIELSPLDLKILLQGAFADIAL
ncbi:MAG: Cys-tRNA(Pro)/Cys-tRNA(Cys) deacylase [Oceanicoccus sp.]|jgi:Cys-tRNA(Pro)/Cys-tRNA(Cys) deacylase